MKLLEKDFSNLVLTDDGILTPDGDFLSLSAASHEIQPFSKVLNGEIISKITSITKKYEIIETKSKEYPLIGASKTERDGKPCFRLSPIRAQIDDRMINKMKQIFAEYEADRTSECVYVNLKEELEAISKELRKYRQFKYKRVTLNAPINVVVEASYSTVQYIIISMIHILNEVGFDMPISIDLRVEGSIVAKTKSRATFINNLSDIERFFAPAVLSGELFLSICENEKIDSSLSRWLEDLIISAKMKVGERGKAPVMAESPADAERRNKIVRMFFEEA